MGEEGREHFQDRKAVVGGVHHAHDLEPILVFFVELQLLVKLALVHGGVLFAKVETHWILVCILKEGEGGVVAVGRTHETRPTLVETLLVATGNTAIKKDLLVPKQGRPDLPIKATSSKQNI